MMMTNEEAARLRPLNLKLAVQLRKQCLTQMKVAGDHSLRKGGTLQIQVWARRNKSINSGTSIRCEDKPLAKKRGQ